MKYQPAGVTIVNDDDEALQIVWDAGAGNEEWRLKFDGNEYRIDDIRDFIEAVNTLKKDYELPSSE